MRHRVRRPGPRRAALAAAIVAVSALALVAEALTESARMRGLLEAGLVAAIFGEMAVWVRLNRWADDRRRAERPQGAPPPPTRWEEHA